LPRTVPQIPDCDIFTYHKSSKQVGGDYYDFFPSGNYMSLLVADISGKGVPAALLMANLHAAFHTNYSEEIDSGQLLGKINS
ncbi:MAG: SpoIIE family protein phosphatase, partial [Aliifodinibius sp.]|nr:SpoIIE family protein phosphatase [Fodinibius sp.]NIV15852.1 SpoIIE family protein phosphatase [Fodinibius sp.]NIY29766.1 SpoIIE family protein phosphatase [Fodinibius sp.]